MNILFLCVENSARSQIAEALAKAMIGPIHLSSMFAVDGEHFRKTNVDSEQLLSCSDFISPPSNDELINIQSAGSNPSGNVHLGVKEILEKNGYETHSLFSKSIHDLDPMFIKNLNYVITLCESEICPVISSHAIKVQWLIPNPIQKDLDQKQIEKALKKTFDSLKFNLKKFRKWGSQMVTPSQYKRLKRIIDQRRAGKTLQEIGLEMDVTRERVRQLESQAVQFGLSSPISISEVRLQIKEKEIQNAIDLLEASDKKDALLSDYQRGYSDNYLCEKYMLSDTVLDVFIENYIKKGKLNRRLKVFDPKKYAKTKERWKIIQTYRKEGKSNDEIAAILGVSSIMISMQLQRMRSNGFDVPDYGAAVSRDYEETRNTVGDIEYRKEIITKMNNEGATKKEIAERLGINGRSLYHFIEVYMIDY